MQINLFLIPFVVLLGLIVASKDSLKGRRFYIITCSLVLIFVAAMRSPEWMTGEYQKDTMNYKMYFEDSFDMGWDQLWQQVVLRYYGNIGDGDIGFILLNKLIGLVTHDFHVYSLIADLIFFVPFGIIIYRYSANVFHLIFAFVFYIALVQTFLFAGARQIYALGFDIMSLLLVVDKKKKYAIITFLLGISIHYSSLLFLVPLLMVWKDVSPQMLKRVHLLCFVLFPIVLFFPNELIIFMGNAVGMDKYADYGKSEVQGGAGVFIFLIESLSLVCLIGIKKRNLIMTKNIQTMYVMVPLFTMAAPLIGSNGAMIRLSLYFHLFLALLVPYAIDCMLNRRQERVIAYFCAIGLLSILAMSGGGVQYYFFWQY